MTRLFTIFFFILSTLPVQAKKMIYPLEVVIGLADLIVVGEIETVHANTYTFRVSETLKGEINETITVEKFEEWMCDTRYAPHETGQRLCLFLQKGIGGWTIINGSTGEKPILKERIDMYFDTNTRHVSINEFKTGIVEFCKCYELIGNYKSYDAKFKQICTNEALVSFKNTNKFTAWLYERMSRYEIVVYKQ